MLQVRRRKRKPCDPNDKDYMLRYILGLLKRRPYPIYELREKLLRKGCNQQAVDDIMVKLKELISMEDLDRDFLEALYLGAVRKGKGPNWFRKRALSAGVPEDKVDFYIYNLNWNDALYECIRRGKMRYKDDLYKIKEYMYRNGFDNSFWDLAQDMMKEG